MIARRIKCLVIEVPVTRTPDTKTQPRQSATDLLPWADPYIAGLIRKLQDEVRAELADPPTDCRFEARRTQSLEAEPLPDLPPLPPEFEPLQGEDYLPRNRFYRPR